jgi:5-formyltetrahydrofolate cyclo-ligase
MNSKKAIRKAYLEKRAQFSMPQMHAMLASMVDRLLEIPLQAAEIALGYKAIPGKNEVPTEVFEQVLLEEGIARKFCYPSVDFGSDIMRAFMDDDDLVWENASFGLLQPRTGNMVPPEKVDIVLVPLLAFDERGNRLGYGKGFYDKFLASCRNDAIKIGLSWFVAETLLPEIHAYDVPLNYCVTPQRLYVF